MLKSFVTSNYKIVELYVLKKSCCQLSALQLYVLIIKVSDYDHQSINYREKL